VQDFVSRGQHTETYTIGLTELCVHFFIKDTVQTSYSYFELRSCASEGDCFIFVFDPDISFLFGRTAETPRLFEALARQVSQVLLPEEYPVLPVSPVRSQWAFPYLEFWMRFRARLCQRHLRLPPDQMSAFQKAIAARPAVLSLDAFAEQDGVFELMLDALLIERSCAAVAVCADPLGTRWRALARWVPRNRLVRHLVAGMPLGAAFAALAEALQVGSAIQALTLVRVGLAAAHARVFEALCARGIAQLSFEGCSFAGCAADFAAVFEHRAVALASLCFASVRLDAAARLVAAAFARVTRLSLRACNVEVAALLEAVSKAPHLVCVDISGNPATCIANPSHRFPPALAHLIANDIAWGQNLAIVFMISMQATAEHMLSLANADLADDGWLFFFKAIPTFPPSTLAGLVWRNNPVAPSLCDFLLKASKLRFLSLAGCDVPADQALARVLQTHPALRIVDLHGTRKRKLADHALLHALASNPIIDKVDISNNALDESALKAVCAIIRTLRTYGELLIDNNAFNTPDGLRVMAEAITGRSRAIFVAFPEGSVPAVGEELQAVQARFKMPAGKESQVPWENEWNLLVRRQYPLETPAAPPAEEAIAPAPEAVAAESAAQGPARAAAPTASAASAASAAPAAPARRSPSAVSPAVP
jgi:hypothetical protein